MSPQPLLSLLGILIRISRTRKHGATLHSTLQALFLQRQLLQLGESVSLGCTIQDRVLEQGLAETWMEDDGLADIGVAGRIFQFPSIAAFVVEETRIVVAFVEIFEDGGEDLGKFFRE